MNARSLILIGSLAVVVAAIVQASQPAAVEIPVGAAKVPFIAGDGAGGFAVSFIQDGAFRFVTYRGGKWSKPRVIAKDAKLFENRADAPSIAVNGKTMFATWSTKNGHGTVVHLARSANGGATWSAAKTPHPQGVSQYGFVSLAPNGEAVWLDGRGLPGGEEGAGDMQLRASGGVLVDGRVCDCCQTAMAMTSAGPIVAYRDRSDDEVRDISIVRKTASGWTKPKTLHEDAWKIGGCPVNGPQLDARGNRVAAAWFTADGNDPRVYVAFSNDAGATFSAPIRVNAGKSAGRVDVVLLADNSALVSHVEPRGEKSILYVRRVQPDGTRDAPVELGEAAGFPRMAISKENVGVTWAAGERIRFALIR